MASILQKRIRVLRPDRYPRRLTKTAVFEPPALDEAGPERVGAPSPYVVEELTAPKGLLLHSSRSGRSANLAITEYKALVNVTTGNTAGLGWHASIGPGTVAVHLTPRQWGWNCREESRNWIAVEFAQPTVYDEISDEQVEAYCWWVQNEVLPVWPDLPHVLTAHSELAPGIRDGKTDVYPRGSAELEAFKERVRNGLGW